MLVREATAADSFELAELFLRNPVRSGTAFVTDRHPDFRALLRLRGESRTFVAIDGARLLGTATALWQDVPDESGSARLGEIVDLRLGSAGRGSTVVWRLLNAVASALAEVRADWAVCLIGDRNAEAASLVRGRAGLPALAPLARYASVHYVACRVPTASKRAGVTVREMTPEDGERVARLAREGARRRWAPDPPFPWPDPSGMHRGWIAEDVEGKPVGGLAVWDGEPVRKIRVMRYSPSQRPLRVIAGLGSRLSLTTRLPPPGDVLRLWGSRWLSVIGDRADVAQALVAAVLRRAAAESVHVVQINVPEDDGLRSLLPRYPRSVYWSTLYGAPLIGTAPVGRTGQVAYHADPAWV